MFLGVHLSGKYDLSPQNGTRFIHKSSNLFYFIKLTSVSADAFTDGDYNFLNCMSGSGDWAISCSGPHYGLKQLVTLAYTLQSSKRGLGFPVNLFNVCIYERFFYTLKKYYFLWSEINGKVLR